MVYDTKGNISIYRMNPDDQNLPIQEKLRELLLPHVPNTEIYALSISSIHGHRDICFNCEARELLYAIQQCFKGNASFKECIYGKALNIPIESIEKHEHFSRLKLYFRYYFKERIELLDSHFLKLSIDIKSIIKEKEDAFCNYDIVFYLKAIPMEMKLIIRTYLICSYETLTYIRALYENKRRELL
mgnify:CR=1 FL=1|tara:strand:+ start:802 stop:1359 length:558 start_codon:yes stop_codon:yes gene_type:complete